jgi:hypothetical protein
MSSLWGEEEGICLSLQNNHGDFLHRKSKEGPSHSVVIRAWPSEEADTCHSRTSYTPRVITNGHTLSLILHTISPSLHLARCLFNHLCARHTTYNSTAQHTQ